jgi:transposase-like protein
MPATKPKSNFKKSKRHFWSRKEKIEIVEHTENFSVASTLNKWDVSKSLVSKWGKLYRNSIQLLGDSSGRKRLGQKTSTVKNDNIEEFAKNLVQKYRNEHKAIPGTVLQEKVAKYASTMNFDVKCSNGWLESFMKRNELSTRTKTSCKQQIP